MENLKKIWVNTQGQELLEYILIIGFIGVVACIAVPDVTHVVYTTIDRLRGEGVVVQSEGFTTLRIVGAVLVILFLAGVAIWRRKQQKGGS